MEAALRSEANRDRGSRMESRRGQVLNHVPKVGEIAAQDIYLEDCET